MPGRNHNGMKDSLKSDNLQFLARELPYLVMKATEIFKACFPAVGDRFVAVGEYRFEGTVLPIL